MFRQKEPEQSEDVASSAERKTSWMKKASKFLSRREGRFAFFLLFACFVNDRIARCWFRMEAFGASGRFSSWLARTNRCANLRQKRGHDTANLPGCHGTPFGFPGQEGRETQFAGQIQLQERQQHDPTPALKLFRGPHVRVQPEQILFEKPEEMIFGEQQTVPLLHQRNFHQINQSE